MIIIIYVRISINLRQKYVEMNIFYIKTKSQIFLNLNTIYKLKYIN